MLWSELNRLFGNCFYAEANIFDALLPNSLSFIPKSSDLTEGFSFGRVCFAPVFPFSVQLLPLAGNF